VLEVGEDLVDRAAAALDGALQIALEVADVCSPAK
jgi:hypothetical protein